MFPAFVASVLAVEVDLRIDRSLAVDYQRVIACRVSASALKDVGLEMEQTVGMFFEGPLRFVTVFSACDLFYGLAVAPTFAAVRRNGEVLAPSAFPADVCVFLSHSGPLVRGFRF